MSTTSQTPDPDYAFFRQMARIINSGQSRSVLMVGNVHDLFYIPSASSCTNSGVGEFAPLANFLIDRCRVAGLILMVYELNGPIRFVDPADRDRLRSAWIAWKSGRDAEQLTLAALTNKSLQRQKEMLEAEFDAQFIDSVGKPTLALEFMRQLTLCSRSKASNGQPLLPQNLLILIEATDFLLPAGDGDVTRMSVTDRHRVSVVQDWFSDPAFMEAGDAVIMLAESRSLVHPRISRLPQVLSVEVPSPDFEQRQHYIDWFCQHGKIPAAGEVPNSQPAPVQVPHNLAALSAGLSLHALRQLLLGAAYSRAPLDLHDVIAKVEEFISSQLGEDVVEFKKPEHSLNDVVGFSQLKEFIEAELLPRFQAQGAAALTGAAVAGPIGGGKTFLFEAVAASLDMPVLVLKNIRSQWFGQTDVIFERLRRVLEALVKVVIFVDEADTQFGGIGPDAHATERRLTGKIQQMMSDPRLKGRVVWLLMTARIHLLSPDIRRPGRVGDLIIPVLDPTGDDRKDFLRWVVGAIEDDVQDETIDRLDALTPGYSAAAFASLRSHLKACKALGTLEQDSIETIVRDHIPPAIERTRRYQTLQALVNCTRRSLLPNPDVTDAEREEWQLEILALEAEGIR